ncbi:hypothetical protein A3I18_02040 [Candidatus Campbellbacteria bacterium RIFCSPLOWO2_02_FULL_35_11]|uniref:Dipeptidylpeptidase IV N-terminal domain-containing protein n=2 Tax=Candidatus Campbelliibacteriota TaxID=1752727 RepID=A0A1F5EP65_9BACT|nr:MAG: hypothetical protein A3E89_03050 [Candidatus Campbellbacteria bacterium RIFCSPHIGHO2_12_FULL_35_10]OGD70565.1 MAG: hypothetical protein A3I18_02040 [Candidatus Campbellbacteria bacterium RIFCSPLOWO2_02_FULL_35_11]
MIKKILIILITILILAIIGIGGFYFFYPKDQVSQDDFSGSKTGFIFGIFGGGDENTGDEIGSSTPITIGDERPLMKLRKISDTPTAGFVVFENKDKETMIRYTEKATGHVFEANTKNSTTERVSNTTIPRIQDAIWVNKDSSVLRYLDDDGTIRSFYAKVVENKSESETDAEGKIEGVFLRDSIADLIPYGSDKILSFMVGENSSNLVVSDLNGGNGFEIFNSSFKDWLVQKPKQGIVALNTKPASVSNGYLYFLNTNNGSLDKILGGFAGMTSLVSPDAEKVIYAENISNSVYFIDENKTEELVISTLPEKCVWNNDSTIIYCGVPKTFSKSEYPDSWYQGIISFSDNIFEVNVVEGYEIALISPEKFSGEPVDVIKPALDLKNEFLFFVNKKDLSLWSLDLRSSSTTSSEEIIGDGEISE